MEITEGGHWIFHPSKFLFPILIGHAGAIERTSITTRIIGWTDVFIFGIRVARIARTKPWESGERP